MQINAKKKKKGGEGGLLLEIWQFVCVLQKVSTSFFFFFFFPVRKNAVVMHKKHPRAAQNIRGQAPGMFHVLKAVPLIPKHHFQKSVFLEKSHKPLFCPMLEEKKKSLFKKMIYIFCFEPVNQREFKPTWITHTSLRHKKISQQTQNPHGC